MITRKETVSNLSERSIGGVYAGNRIACQLSLEVIRTILEDHLLDRTVAIGQLLERRFLLMKKKYNVIGDVHGLKVLTAVELVKDRDVKEPATQETEKIVKYCVQNGFLFQMAESIKNVLRVLVSLVVTDEQLEETLDVVEEGMIKINHNNQ